MDWYRGGVQLSGEKQTRGHGADSFGERGTGLGRGVLVPDGKNRPGVRAMGEMGATPSSVDT